MNKAIDNKLVVISAINFYEGGPLSILLDLLTEISNQNYSNFKFIIFIHKLELIKSLKLPTNILFQELPKARKNYLYRLYYEYIYFYHFSKRIKIDLWFSLHDITPNVISKRRLVYCHNPTPFYKKNIKDLFIYPNLFLSSIFYKYIYQINIKNNDFVIVQPYWIKKEFVKLFGLDPKNIIVATPILTTNIIKVNKINQFTSTTFFYPCMPRPFKNIEVIAEACKILKENGIANFRLLLTIGGNENSYSKRIFNRFKGINEIEFLGKLPRESVFKIYESCDVLLFPSSLETWGLPLTEFKMFDKPILVSNLPYAKETIGDYKNVSFLETNNPQVWANAMRNIVLKMPIIYDGNMANLVPEPKANKWSKIFEIVLN